MLSWMTMLALLLQPGGDQAVMRGELPPDGALMEQVRFRPVGTTVRGLPLAAFDRQWCAADEISPEAFPAALRGAGERSVDSYLARGMRFSLSGNLGSGMRLDVLAGAYETCAGARGNFVAVLAPGRTGEPARIVQIETTGASDAVFLHLGSDPPEAGFRVYSCIACDDTGRHYLWNPVRGRFELQPEPDPPIAAARPAGDGVGQGG